MLEIETFGGLSVRLSGRPLDGFASRKAEALLVYLALAGQPVPRPVLADLFWEESPEGKAMTNLRVALASINKQLDAFLEVDRQSVGLHSSANLWVDTLEFERSLAEGDIESGLVLYKGDFLEGFHLRGSSRFEDWQTFTRESCRLRMQESLHDHVNGCLARNDLKTGQRYARRLLEMDSFDETALRRTMEILARSGQRNAALLQFGTYEDLYRDQLGVDPEPETIELAESIRQGEMQGERAAVRRPGEHPPGAGQWTRASPGLPEPPTPFVGREKELARLGEWLSDPDKRLITILGPGGMGKTRLCLEAGKAQAGRFDDGVFFLPLASIEGHDEMLSALAEAFGLRGSESVDLESVLLHVLTPRKTLLLLDNFDHLVKEAPFLVEILKAAPGVNILTTSRERLNLRNERVFPLGGMGYATQEEESIIGGHGSAALFLQTAKRLNPDFTLSAANQLFVDKICRLVEGMPLAIELAASWVDTLSLEEIAEQIETSLDILAAEVQDAPARHQSIRLVFESTYQTLEPALKETFNSLSVFRGSFSSRAAQRIASASPYQLKTLVNKSLLSPLEAGRFQVHELLRQYANEKLSEAPGTEKTAGDRHCGYYAEFLLRRDAQIEDGETDEAFQEIENIRAGFRWAVRHDKILEISQYLPGINQLLGDRRPGDMISLFSWALTRLRSGEPSREKEISRGSLLSMVGVQEYLSGEHERGKENALEGLLILRRSGCQDRNLADALLMAINLGVFGRNYDYAPLLQEGLYIYRATGSQGIEFALIQAGEFELGRGEHEAAKTYFTEALDASIRRHGRRGIAWSSFNLGRVAEAQGSLLAAIDHFQKSAALFKEIQYKQLYAVANKYLGSANYFLGQYPTAIHYYQRFLEVSQETGIQWRLAEAYSYLGKTMLEMGDIDLAEEYLLRAREICKDPGANVQLGFLLPDLGLLAFTRGDHQTAAEYYFSALHNEWSDQTKSVRLHAMAQMLPVLEKTGNTTLAGITAAFILADPAYHQITTIQPAKDYLKKRRSEIPQEAYQAILDQGEALGMEEILAELDGVLQNL